MSALKEIVDNGYCIRKKTRKGNKFSGYDYLVSDNKISEEDKKEFFEVSCSGFPDTGNQHTGNQHTGNPPLVNTNNSKDYNLINTNIKKKNINKKKDENLDLDLFKEDEIIEGDDLKNEGKEKEKSSAKKEKDSEWILNTFNDVSDILHDISSNIVLGEELDRLNNLMSMRLDAMKNTFKFNPAFSRNLFEYWKVNSERGEFIIDKFFDSQLSTHGYLRSFNEVSKHLSNWGKINQNKLQNEESKQATKQSINILSDI